MVSIAKSVLLFRAEANFILIHWARIKEPAGTILIVCWYDAVVSDRNRVFQNSKRILCHLSYQEGHGREKFDFISSDAPGLVYSEFAVVGIRRCRFSSIIKTENDIITIVRKVIGYCDVIKTNTQRKAQLFHFEASAGFFCPNTRIPSCFHL